MNIYLETDRVILRNVTTEDEDSFFELDSDAEVMKYLTNGRPSSRPEIQATITRLIQLNQKHQQNFGLWVAIEKSSGLFMGWFLMRPCKKDPDNTRSLEIGYRLKKDFWKKGYGSEVAYKLLQKGFQYPFVEEIFATAMVGNTGSTGVMKKIGLHFDRFYSENDFPGLDKSAVRYSLSREEFLKSSS